MKSLMKKVREFARDEEGQGLVEYVLLVALIAVVCIVMIALIGTRANNKFNNVAQHLAE